LAPAIGLELVKPLILSPLVFWKQQLQRRRIRMGRLTLTHAILTCVFTASVADTKTWHGSGSPLAPARAPSCVDEQLKEFDGKSSLIQVVSGSSSQVDVDDIVAHESHPEATMERDPTKMTFHCKVGIVHWAKGWSDLKKKYCCQTEHVGCLDTTDVTDNKKGPNATDKPIISETCLTDEPLEHIMGYTTSPAGTKCVFGLDERDERKHCILEDMKYGSLGWCYTSESKDSWGPCSESCPLFGPFKVLGNKVKQVHNEIEKLTKHSPASKLAPKPMQKVAATKGHATGHATGHAKGPHAAAGKNSSATTAPKKKLAPATKAPAPTPAATKSPGAAASQ